MNKTIFGTYDSYSDFHLLETSFQKGFPQIKENLVDVPGMNGTLDLSNAVAGFPIYKTRELRWSFSVVPSYLQTYDSVVSTVSNALIASEVDISKSEISGGWKFHGKITSITEKRDGRIRKLEVVARCNPFMTKEVTRTVQIDTSGTTVTIVNPSDYPIFVTFSPNVNAKVSFNGESIERNVHAGASFTPNVCLTKGTNSIVIKAESTSGNMVMNWNEGSL